jgi:thiol-disulfide isomerase/thioredoxin
MRPIALLKTHGTVPAKAVFVLGIASLWMVCCVGAAAQDVLRVPLHIVPAVPSIGWSVTYPEAPGAFSAPGNVKLESLAPASSGCRFRLANGEEVSLRFGDWQVLNIRRGDRLLPYEAICEEYEKAGQKHHRLSWNALYRAEGMLAVGDCKRLVAVQDINGDGVFDQKDLSAGTAFGVEINGDLQIRGKGEWLFSADVFEVCGKRWELAGLSPQGDWVEFRESKLAKVSVGGPVPAFTLQMDNGETVDSQKLRGRWYLLDFWASWCVPCLEKFPQVKQLGNELGDRLAIYLVNVDEPERLQKAKEAILKYDLAYAKAWPGLGDADPVWRMFGALPDDHFAIPLYVLVDPENRIAAATREVNEVRAAILKHH